MGEKKEKVERALYKVDTKLASKVAGERSLSAGELLFTLIGAALVVYGLWKLEGDAKKAAVVGGLLVIFVGELVW